MKILLICNEYPPLVHGGIGTFCRDLAEGLAGQGHQVWVLGIYDSLPARSEEVKNGVTVIREKASGLNNAYLQVLHNLYLLNRLTWRWSRHLQTDVVESPEYLGLFPFGKVIAKGVFIVRLHGAAIFFDKELNRPGNRLTHLLERLTIRHAGHLVAVSDFCGKRTLNHCRLEQKQYTVIYNAIDTHTLANDSPEYKHGLIVFANTVNPKKGVAELVRAFNQVGKEFPEAQLVIIGKTLHTMRDGSNIREFLYSLADPAVAGRLHFTGWLSSRQELEDWLRKAHVCVYPSHMEGFGIAPVEAMAMGKPTIYMNSGPGPEVIDHGVDGLLCDTQSPEDIADAIRQIFRDDALRSRLAHNARAKVLARFDRDSWILENIRFYERISGDHTHQT